MAAACRRHQPGQDAARPACRHDLQATRTGWLVSSWLGKGGSLHASTAQRAAGDGHLAACTAGNSHHHHHAGRRRLSDCRPGVACTRHGKRNCARPDPPRKWQACCSPQLVVPTCLIGKALHRHACKLCAYACYGHMHSAGDAEGWFCRPDPTRLYQADARRVAPPAGGQELLLRALAGSGLHAAGRASFVQTRRHRYCEVRMYGASRLTWAGRTHECHGY